MFIKIIKHCQIFERKSVKIDKRGAQKRSWTKIGSSWRMEGVLRPGISNTFGATWLISNGFWDPAGRHGGSQINYFGNKAIKKLKK